MKNILHMKTSSSIGGAETMLCFWPALLNKSEFSQYFIMGDDGPLVEAIKKYGCEAIVLKRLGSYLGFLHLLHIIFFIKKNKIDLIHAHGARVNLWGSLISLLTNVPIVSTEHNVDLWRDKSSLFNSIDRLIGEVNTKRIGVSQAVCEMLNVKNISNKKVICINNGIDLERFERKYDKVNYFPSDVVNEGSVIIGTVGRLVEQKGQKYLIEAFSLLQRVYDNIFLVIVGEGPLYGDLKNYALKIVIDDKVVFTGVRNDIPACMASFDIFVLPSITEGLPLVLLEAMASKKPVVASAVSGIPYVIEGGLDGLLVPAADTEKLKCELEILIKNSTLRKTMGDMAFHKVARNFSAKRMIEDYEKVYLEVIGMNNEYK